MLASPLSNVRWRRWRVTLINAASQLFLPLLSPVVAWLVLRVASAAVWGEFVGWLVIVQLGAHLIGWGNKEYLLREFSRAPARVATLWQTSLFTRLGLLVFFTLGVGGWFTGAQAMWLVIWCGLLALDQSFEVLVTYHHAFGVALLIDLCGLGSLGALVWLNRAALTPEVLLRCYVGVTALQVILLATYFRHLLAHWRPQIDLAYFPAALSFFLLGLSGLLQSRIDLYAVNAYLPKAEVGRYQILSSFLLYLQALAAYGLTPWVKSLYRLNRAAFLKLTARLMGLGALLIPPALFGLQWLLGVHYHLEWPFAFWLVSALFVWPIYCYLPIIYWLYKQDQARWVLAVNFFGAALNLVLNLWLLPTFTVLGALVANAVAQWGMLGVYLAVISSQKSVAR